MLRRDVRSIAHLRRGCAGLPSSTTGLLLLIVAVSLEAQGAKDKLAKVLGPKPNVADASLVAYLARVRTEGSAEHVNVGAIWSDNGRLARLSTDVRAMRPHDLIQVVVQENLAASTDGTVKNSRASNASSSITGLIGALHAGNALQNLINQTSASGLNAQGTSATKLKPCDDLRWPGDRGAA